MDLKTDNENVFRKVVLVYTEYPLAGFGEAEGYVIVDRVFGGIRRL